MTERDRPSRTEADGASRPGTARPEPSLLDRLFPLLEGLPVARRRAVALGLGGAAAVMAAYAALTAAGAGRDPATTTLVESLYYVVGLATVALCVARAILVARGRSAALLLSTGIFVWLVADLCSWVVYGNAVPVPSVLDIGYLAFYPASYAAIFVLARRDVRRLPSSARLDGLIGALAVAGIAAEFAIRPIVQEIGGNTSQVATNLAYPIGDLLLVLFVVAVVAVSRWAPDRRWTLLAAGFLLTAVADTGYLIEVAAGTYRPNGMLDTLWPLGLLVLAFAAWQPPARRAPASADGVRVILLPNLFVLAAIALLLRGDFVQEGTGALVLACCAVVTGAVRIGMTFREVSALAETRRQAVTDELTGLLNRRGLGLALRGAFDAAATSSGEGALLLVDLDRFKELNDTLGHHAGDLLLRQVAARMASALRPVDVLGRLGGDEFAVVVSPPCVPERFAADLLGSLVEESFVVGEVHVHVDASVGIARYPADARDPDELMRRADVALYQAKRAQEGYASYEATRDDYSLERLELLGELRDAIRRNELVVHYQPKVALESRRVVGVEALVRWRHPTRGVLLPAAFIPFTEQTALARPLAVFVIAQALRQLRSWLDDGLDLVVSVNVSTANLLDESFPEAVEGLLRESGIASTGLLLEMTENAILTDPRRARVVLAGLDRLGVAVSLDDFGTGFSSISHLKDLAVCELKIDRSFVTNIMSDPNDAEIVRTMIDLGRRLGTSVVAEGVETAEALERLAELGCELAQGYHVSPPLPAEELTPWLLAGWSAEQAA